MTIPCYVCGREEDKVGIKTVKLSRTLFGHISCYVAHQIFQVLNAGQEDRCPRGRWLVNWKPLVNDYVDRAVADEVRKALATIEDDNAH